MTPVTKPYFPEIDKYVSYLKQMYKAERLTNNGPLVVELEEVLKHYLGVRNILLVANGTIALQLAYKLAGLSGEVITTPFSFVATTSSLLWEGLTPVFVDVDKNTFNINPEKVEAGITESTSAIVATHVFGNPCETLKLKELAEKHNLKLIYDAAHAFAVRENGVSALSAGDMSTLSFHATKLFHTGEGGALVINDDELYSKAKRIINFGIEGDGNISDIGINGKMSELQAAMGLCVLDDLESILQKRKEISSLYFDGLKDVVRFQEVKETVLQNYSYFPVVFEEPGAATRVKYELMRKGIDARRYFFPSLNRLSFLRSTQQCKESELLASTILCLPSHFTLDSSTQKLIIDTVREAVY
ncbi:MAG: DegT/DnrJ/EryC1/StrS family aminotransferase [Gammaproteobacteria bacterium]|nr:DegT/DnrJ/EryC1/StrS family aminotransferase [Gammaproteobacteria bacterium]